ncbi:MAG: corrinoid protein [Candidatus Wallbacteria bacterium]|nr:corrinoid protein [Candidatus Wallbacteria bacterium]
MDLLKDLSLAIQEGDEDKAVSLTKNAIKKKVKPNDILDKGLIAGMNVISEKFKNHEIFLPDVLMAAKAMQLGLDELKPLLVKADIKKVGKVVIGSVHGDLHDIGKNLVSIMLKGAGFEVIDLGHDVPAEKFVETAKKEGADFIGMSALLTTTMPVMKEVVDLLKKQKLTGKIKTVVGGAPLSEKFAKSIGADAYAYDAANAVDSLKGMLKKKK